MLREEQVHHVVRDNHFWPHKNNFSWRRRRFPWQRNDFSWHKNGFSWHRNRFSCHKIRFSGPRNGFSGRRSRLSGQGKDFSASRRAVARVATAYTDSRRGGKIVRAIATYCARTSPTQKNKKITPNIRPKTHLFRFCCAQGPGGAPPPGPVGDPVCARRQPAPSSATFPLCVSVTLCRIHPPMSQKAPECPIYSVRIHSRISTPPMPTCAPAQDEPTPAAPFAFARYKLHPFRNSGWIIGAASGHQVACISWAFHSIFLPVRSARFPTSSASVSRAA